MNAEELKQLKKGDEFFVKMLFDRLASDGDAYGQFTWTNCRGERIASYLAVTPDSVFLRSALQQPAEKPKYDPCRKFKKGDKVHVVERHGRKFWNAAPETIYTVVADEYLHDDPNVLLRGCVALNDGRHETLSAWNIPFFHLELVTPVEELEPYFVFADATSWQVKKGKSLCARYGKATHPHAKEAAEAECDRLNAEYRKEQDNGNK